MKLMKNKKAVKAEDEMSFKKNEWSTDKNSTNNASEEEELQVDVQKMKNKANEAERAEMEKKQKQQMVLNKHQKCLKEISENHKQIALLKSQVKKYIQSHNKLMEIRSQIQGYRNDLERMKKSVEDERKKLNFELAREIIEPVDWLEQTLANADEDSSWLKGLQFIIDRFLETLKNHSIEQIKMKVGDKFNPKTAEVIEAVENKNFKHDYIVQIVQKGYKVGDHIIRHAKVKVAK